MTIRFDLPELLEALEEEQEEYDIGPSFPYPSFGCQSARSQAMSENRRFSLVKLNVRGGNGCTSLELTSEQPKEQRRERRKVLLQIP